MKDMDIFDLYKLVQNRDKEAIKELYRRHKLKYPMNCIHDEGYNIINRKEDLHMMYIHLT